MDGALHQVSENPRDDLNKFYDSGVTKSYAFRVEQLNKLRNALAKYENEIAGALTTDLKKSPEESYATETGLVIAEVNLALKKLRKWMRPKRVPTNLVNIPSASYIYRDPLGVVFIIAPWNYPFQLLFLPLIGAIAGGNCVVLKPSELAPATAALSEKIIREIYPEDYIRVIQGEGADVVPATIRSIHFDHIFYTGSIPVGKSVYQLAASKLIPVTLELGGKSPAIVEQDANLRIAARRIALGKFINAGQSCVAPDYLLIHESVKNPFIAFLKESIQEFFGSDPATSENFGKIINRKRFNKLVSYLSMGNILTGGQFDEQKMFVAPTIMDGVDLNSALMAEEIFGPVLPVFTFTEMAEAFAIVQRQANPLSFYLFTADKNKEKSWIESLPFGGGCINNTAWQFVNNHLPFGGIGASGIGAYHGKYSFEVFTHAKPVMKTPTWIDPSIKYPPFKGKMKWFKRFIR
ncbi:MAG: aldehyde dehydrogenase family protein [Bacteroidetes bacterium]|nr:MAG: aldehyde dehydrogenase family protein [Bacteroidota bacterium]